MRSIEELVNTAEPGIELIKDWLSKAEVPCQLLDASDTADLALLNLQVTTRSPLGALAYNSGGLLVQNGWLRFLGSGNTALPRRIDLWNKNRSEGYLLVADDVVGGFFALNAGALGSDLGHVYYWAPDDIDWIPLEVSFSDFLKLMLTTHINDFYQALRWPSWEEDLASLSPDSSFIFYPFLWTEQGSVSTSSRSSAPIGEVYEFKVDALKQLYANGA